MTKAKVRDIFPLTYNQKILLFHHLSTHEDSGIIQVKCIIEGEINQEAFNEAWSAAIKQYDVLRTSIQWKNLSKQLQVVQDDAELEIDWVDLKGESNPVKLMKEYELKDREKPVSLSQAPVSRLTVFQQKENQYQLLWTCHHILFDGWSSRLILQDVFRYYDLAVNGQELNIEKSTPSMIDYLKAVEKQSKDKEARHFWKNQIDDKQFPNRIADFHKSSEAKDNFQSIQASIPGDELLQLAKEHHLTFTSIIQTAWLLTLKWFHQFNLVATGTVVSGRGLDFPGIENIAGLLSNVLPIIHQFQPGQSIVEAAKQVQKHHAKARNFESISIDRIKEWCHWEGNPNLFDTLLVIENFIDNELTSRHLNIKNYNSGLTTTYPVTIAIVPEETIQLVCIWNERVVNTELAKQLLNNFMEVLSSNFEQRIDQISDSLGEPLRIDRSEVSKEQEPRDYVSVTTQTELELTKIWEKVLGLNAIGVKDNFFALGGKSIQALQLFQEIEYNFDKTLLPSVLIQHPTIHELAKLISDDEEVEFNCIVPLKSSGEKPPLFCIHAGGAHVFLYKQFAESFGVDYPVYAIQPKGLDGGEMHHSIEEMAKDYLKEIRAITSHKKIYLLGYCFSKAVCLEIARITKDQNIDVELIIVDSANMPWFQKQRLMNNKRDLVLRFEKKILKGYLKVIEQSFKRRLDRLKEKFGGSTDNGLHKGLAESESDTEHHLKRMNLNLDSLIYKYHWKPVQKQIHFIRSSANVKRKEKNYHVDIWKTLSKNELSIYQVDSKHITIFEGNSVVEMARLIENIIGHEVE